MDIKRFLSKMIIRPKAPFERKAHSSQNRRSQLYKNHLKQQTADAIKRMVLLQNS